MISYTPDEARAAAGRAVRGALGRDGEILADVLRLSAKRADRTGNGETTTREANALAAIIADILDIVGSDEISDEIDPVLADLPLAARRRVLAYRHRNQMFRDFRPSDQFGPLPAVPAREKVLRDALTVVIDLEPVSVRPS